MEAEEVHATNKPGSNPELVAWLDEIENSATNEVKIGGSWVELVKVKKWYSLRLMRWDATNKRKVYVKYLGTLTKCKANATYSDEATRLEKRRFGLSGGEIVTDTGTP